MVVITKVVISVDHAMLSIELIFNILQRKAFSENKLDIYILTSNADNIKEMTEYIEKCCFSNMNEIVVTEDSCRAFKNADFFLLMTTPNVHDKCNVENFQDLVHVFDMAKSFDRLAKANARVLMMGLQIFTWLQIFAEVATNLSKFNFTGLSRHHASKALAIIAQKLNCEVRDLSDVFIRGKNYLDLVNGKKRTHFYSEAFTSFSKLKKQNMLELLPLDWIDNSLKPQFEIVQTKINNHCVVSAVCHHITDWYKGTGNKTVSMVATIRHPGQIDNGIYSSYPVIIDKMGNIIVSPNIETDSLLFVKLYSFHENQQKEKCRIRNYLDHTASIQTNDD